jgi:hypothetical protein
MPLFRKRPVTVEARLVTHETQLDIALWCLGVCYYDEGIAISTREGTMRASMGDWVIKGVQGEFYPCKPDIFQQTYEPVSDETSVYGT